MNVDRIKEIQQETAYPESRSVQQALLKVWNETAQSLKIGQVDAVVSVLEWISPSKQFPKPKKLVMLYRVNDYGTDGHSVGFWGGKEWWRRFDDGEALGETTLGVAPLYWAEITSPINNQKS